MLPYGSASSLPLSMKCAPAAVLPHVDSDGERARECSAIHEHLQLRSSHGVDEAMAAMKRIATKWRLTHDQAARVTAECRDFEWSPPAGSLGEVGLCWMRDGSVTRVKGGQGKYALPEGGIIPGTSDVIWSEPEPLDLSDPEHPKCPPGSILWVADYKAGQERYVEPVEWNSQALFNTVAAARWTGAQYAIPAIIFVRRGRGEWDVPESALGPRELEALAETIPAYTARVDEERRKLAAGEPLSFVEGRHCTWCSAAWQCGAKVELMRKVADRAVRFPQMGEPLSEEQAVFLAENLGFFEGFARQARGLLRDHVDADGPILMSDGDEWGPIFKAKVSIDVRIAVPILRDELGMGDDAIGVLADTLTKTDVYKLCDVAKAKGRAVKTGRLMKRLDEAGAIRRTDSATYGIYRPKGLHGGSRGNVIDLDEEVVL